MKYYPGFDYAFRPASYWDAPDPLAAIVGNILGENRRKLVGAACQSGAASALDPCLLSDVLSNAERDRLGRLGPSFLGGEYLPGYKSGEIEIARVVLQSTTTDVIALRARPVASGIAYRVVDEYESTFVLPIAESSRPLTLAEVVRQLDEGSGPDFELKGGLSLGFNQACAVQSGDRTTLRHFTRIYSSLYRDLEKHYECVFEAWAGEATAQ